MLLTNSTLQATSAFHHFKFNVDSRNKIVSYFLRLTYISEVSGDGDRSRDLKCLRSCVNQMKETEAETATDAKFGVLSPSRA